MSKVCVLNWRIVVYSNIPVSPSFKATRIMPCQYMSSISPNPNTNPKPNPPLTLPNPTPNPTLVLNKGWTKIPYILTTVCYS